MKRFLLIFLCFGLFPIVKAEVVKDIQKHCEGSKNYNYCVMMWEKINKANKPLTYAEEMTVGFWLGRSCFFMYGPGKGQISTYEDGKDFVRELLVSEGFDPSLANREDLLDKATNEIIKKGNRACYSN